MLKAAIRTLIDFCTRWPWTVVLVSALLAVGAGIYTAQNFAINTDISRLISPDLGWRKREIAYQKAFPQGNNILAVIDASTSEAATEVAIALRDELSQRKDLIEQVSAPAETPFFAKSALLYMPTSEVRSVTGQLEQLGPLLHVLAGDPTLRGLGQALTAGMMSAQVGEGGLSPLTGVLTQASATVDNVLAGKPTHFSWRELVAGKQAGNYRRFLVIDPVLDYAALQPGKAASDLIRRTVDELKLKDTYGATVRLTGTVPIADEEFATIAEGALPNMVATLAIVLVILWLALRSARIILAVFLSVAVGLALTAAAGLMMVGALNLISVAFAVLFVGIGVDFGIQFSVRYRAERHAENDLRKALVKAGEHIAAPLSLAAAATAAGFLAFVPTDYRGVSELGQIAGLGMIIAFLGSITVLPALLTIRQSAGRARAARLCGVGAGRPVSSSDTVFQSCSAHGGGGGCRPLALFPQLRFQSDPFTQPGGGIDCDLCRRAQRPSCRRRCRSTSCLPIIGKQAESAAKRLSKVSEVASVRTLASFVPGRSDHEIADDPRRRDNASADPDRSDAPLAQRCGKRRRAQAPRNRYSITLPARSSGPGAQAAKRLAARSGVSLQRRAPGRAPAPGRLRGAAARPTLVGLLQCAITARAGHAKRAAGGYLNANGSPPTAAPASRCCRRQ